MNRRLMVYGCGCLLLLGLLLAAGWASWSEPPSDNAWVVERSEQIVSGATVGEELYVAFTLRNTSSRPRRILGAEAC
jgi:hypothetical protein